MESIDRQGPTLIRHDYGYKDTHPGGYSPITRFDADRSDNPQPKANRIIRQANQREVDYMKGDLRYEQGGSMDMPLPESIRGDKMFQNSKYIGKLGDQFDGDADSGYAAGDLRFFSFYDDGFFVVDKDNNVWSTDKWYMKEGDEDQEYSMDDYVKDNLGAEKFMIEGKSYVGLPEKKMAREATGGMGASATEDLLERLGQYKRNAYGNKYEQGGEVKGNGYSIKIPGQYAYEPIATTESGEQYVTMELPDGTMATVFGDWETYGNPNQQGYIEDLDYRIIPRGDGSYDLDAGEMESEMLRDEARGFARDTQGGPGATRMQDLLEKLSDRPGMGFTPEGRMRPIKRR